MFDGLAGKADALVGHAVTGGGIEVNTDDASELNVIACFFKGFADSRLDQAFIRVQMTGRLVEDCAVAFELFNH